VMQDPKKLSEPVTPVRPAPSPRRNVRARSILSFRVGHCMQCRKPYSNGERIIVNSDAHDPWTADGYHVACWTEITRNAVG
jgi:hypothetical protein